MTSTSHIPVVDLAAVRALNPAGLREAAAAIRDACTSIGFFYVSNHGVPTDVLVLGPAAITIPAASWPGVTFEPSLNCPFSEPQSAFALT